MAARQRARVSFFTCLEKTVTPQLCARSLVHLWSGGVSSGIVVLSIQVCTTISEPRHQGPTYSVASGLGAHLLGHPHTRTWEARSGAGQGLYFCHAATPHQQERHPCQARRPDETPLAGRATSRKGEILGEVEAPDVATAKAAAVVQFDLDEVQRGRIMVQELG